MKKDIVDFVGEKSERGKLDFVDIVDIESILWCKSISYISLPVPTISTMS